MEPLSSKDLALAGNMPSLILPMGAASMEA
jgi:hypothetical protein